MKTRITWTAHCYETQKTGEIYPESGAWFWHVEQLGKGGAFVGMLAQGSETDFAFARAKVEKLITAPKARKGKVTR